MDIEINVQLANFTIGQAVDKFLDLRLNNYSKTEAGNLRAVVVKALHGIDGLDLTAKFEPASDLTYFWKQAIIKFLDSYSLMALVAEHQDPEYGQNWLSEADVLSGKAWQ
tara:strand:- start:12 stop:341 length:330 start_codon:yes stop_codon:yes gene_type:complete